MGRILLAWELGANFGHLAQLHAVAATLRSSGHEVTFAVRDLTHAHRLLGREHYRIVAAPTPPVPRLPIRPVNSPNSYVDILALQGMADIDCLASVVAAWQDLFTLGRFDALVGESAPLAALAGAMNGLPHLVLGTGFTLPPSDGPFPLFRRESTLQHEQRMRTEAEILSALNVVAEANGKRDFDRTSEIFRSAKRLLVTWPELDHYGRKVTEEFIGPLPTMLTLCGDMEVQWPEGERRVLAYLQPDYPNLDTVLQLLSELGLSSIVVIPGGEAWSRQFGSPSMRVLTRRASFAALLPAAELVVFHGGHNLAVEALCCGKSLLMLPHQIEQAMLARRLAMSDLGIALSPGQQEGIRAAMFALLDGRHRQSSLRFAQEKTRHDANATALRIADYVAALL